MEDLKGVAILIGLLLVMGFSVVSIEKHYTAAAVSPPTISPQSH
jgi:hypothetical protein